ncbi:LacI family transcriptional regulator [Bifidobacterium ramosum]|uniref:LacI family DNA-binding transcriptional regulator n=1 Tax=Bifidobacterium ramosum TaxID=1798158 RepID=A0A6L4X0S8_9BIFI|nr:LacI family DNA-binding transcriptional regulator [Bifidobacterium ramosum]KAB8288401.1 LacI family transcriptional regulator [Bifidobacterium ramosum]NEG71564.1 LacI family DNA-binding transcriptional regulator [Bifidobacterium ramosum]
MTDANGAAARVTLHDVAKAAGVSIGTVSNYMNGYPYMSAATKERVQDAIDQLGYVVNGTARNLRRGVTRLLSLSIPDLTQVYFAELAEEVIQVAREYDYGVIVESTGYDAAREMHSIQIMSQRMTDGLILSPLKLSDGDARKIKGDFPLVVLGESMFGVDAPHIIVQNIYAAKAATCHLVSAGCRSIAIVGGAVDPGNVSARSLRTEGYVAALREYGLPVDQRLIRETGDWNSRAGARAISDMMQEGLRFDGVFACNDMLAFGVISQLKEMGVSVPAQVQVVGFDNIDESQYTTPSLTTIDPGRRQIAKLAVESILEQVNQGRRAPKQRIEVEYSLVCRQSSPGFPVIGAKG